MSFFLSGSGVRLIDSFEDNSLSEYTTHGTWNTPQEFPAHGDRSLEFDGNNGSHTGIVSLSGLDHYPERGEDFRANGWLVTANNGFGVQFGLQEDRNAFAQGYSVRVNHQNTGELLLRFQDPSGTFGGDSDLDTAAISLAGRGTEHLELIVEWDSPTITGTLNAEDGTQLGQVSASDSTFDSGGFGWTASINSSQSQNQFVYMDYARITQ